jgi:hypothetical protein
LVYGSIGSQSFCTGIGRASSIRVNVRRSSFPSGPGPTNFSISIRQPGALDLSTSAGSKTTSLTSAGAFRPVRMAWAISRPPGEDVWNPS